MKITIYSTKTCPYCVMLKRWLDEKSVPYTNHNVEDDHAAAEKMVSLSGQMGVPFSTIEFDDGKMTKILGFDRPEFEIALRTAKIGS